MLYMNVKQIAEKAGVNPNRVYYIKNQIGHLPTVKEVKEYKPKRPAHRPAKFKLEESENENVEV